MENGEEKIAKIQDLQNRLYREDDELFEKIMKLEDFLNTNNKFTNISNSQRNLLEVQFQAMRTYHQTLRARINDFQQEIFKINEQN